MLNFLVPITQYRCGPYGFRTKTVLSYSKPRQRSFSYDTCSQNHAALHKIAIRQRQQPFKSSSFDNISSLHPGKRPITDTVSIQGPVVSPSQTERTTHTPRSILSPPRSTDNLRSRSIVKVVHFQEDDTTPVYPAHSNSHPRSRPDTLREGAEVWKHLLK